MTADEKAAWRREWLLSLLSLADLPLQKDRWLNPDITHPRWSYVEFICAYFDDALAAREYPHFVEVGLVSLEEAEALHGFHRALQNYNTPDGPWDHAAILSDENWAATAAKGHAALQKLEAMLTDPAEKALFTTKAHAPALTAADLSWPAVPS